MNKFFHPLSFILIITAIISCQNNKIVNPETVSIYVDSPQPKKEVVTQATYKIDYDKEIVVRKVFVIDRKGLELKQQPDENSETLGRYEFGTQVEVIEDGREWLGIRERINRNYEKEDGTKVESSQWEKVYVSKQKTGGIEEIVLVPEDLIIITSISVNNQSEFFEKGSPLKGQLGIELIDKKLFDSKKNSEINFLLADTTVIKKENGIIELPVQNKTLKIIDKPEEGDYREEFRYVGQVEFLNQYLIAGSYYESMDYRFLDKTSGKETQVFGEYPHISPDKKNIICIYGNPYESTSDLELYSINNQQIKLMMSASFNKWMPTNDPTEIFYSADGYLYLAVIHFKAFWGERPDLKPKKQFIRIKIL
ncbi:MAG: hypothetical protein ABI266_02225 [Ginsengibacter sp.]